MPVSCQAEPARRRSSSPCAARRSRSSRFPGPGSAEAPDLAVSGSVTNSRPWTWRASRARRYRGSGGCGGCGFRHPGAGRSAPVGQRSIGATVRTAGGRGRHRWPRTGAPQPVSSRARHTECPPGANCVENHPRGLPDHGPSGSLFRSGSRMTQRDRGRSWSHRHEGTPRPPARRAANRMALVSTRCRSPEPTAGTGAGRNPCHGRVPHRTGRLHHRWGRGTPRR